MTPIPPRLADQIWNIAGHIEWAAEDWQDFYESLTAVFARIAARHAKRKIDELSK